MPSRLQNLRLAVAQQRAQAPKGSAAAAAAAAAAALAGDTCELSSFQLGEMCRASRPQASIWNFAFTDFAEPPRAETTIPVCQQAAQTPASGKQTHDGLQRHKRCRLIACGHLVMLKLDLKICLTAEMTETAKRQLFFQTVRREGQQLNLPPWKSFASRLSSLTGHYLRSLC